MADLTGTEDAQHIQRVIALSVTCGRDGREHLVAEEAMTAGGAGRYPALCGHAVWAVALACPAGPPCLACAVIRNPGTANARRYRRMHRPGVGERLTSWLNRIRLRRYLSRFGSPSGRHAAESRTESGAVVPDGR
ncbi:MAG: hypothetical protein ACRDTC_25885 [Pseudonocardiaceae bacterium]